MLPNEINFWIKILLKNLKTLKQPIFLFTAAVQIFALNRVCFLMSLKGGTGSLKPGTSTDYMKGGLLLC